MPTHPTLNCPVCNGPMTVTFTGDQMDKLAVCQACGTRVDVPDRFQRTRTRRTTRRGLFGSTTVEEVVAEGRSDLSGQPAATPHQAGMSSQEWQQRQVKISTTAQASGQSSGCAALFVVVLVMAMIIGITGAVFGALSGSVGPLEALFNAATGRESLRVINNHVPLAAPDTVTALAVSPDGSLLAVGDGSGNLTFWSWPDRQQLEQISVSDDDVTALAFHPDGTRFALASERNLSVWDATTRRRQWTVRSPAGHQMEALHFTPDGRLVALAFDTLLFFDPQSGRQLNRWTFDSFTRDFDISPDGRWLAVVINNNTITIFDLESDEMVQAIKIDEYLDGQIAFSSAGQLAVALNKEILIYDVPSWQLVRTLSPGDATVVFSVETITFSPGGRYLAAGNFFDPVLVWAVDSGAVRVKLEDIATSERLVFTPDGQHILSAGGIYTEVGRGMPGNVVRVWSAFDGVQADPLPEIVADETATDATSSD